MPPHGALPWMAWLRSMTEAHLLFDMFWKKIAICFCTIMETGACIAIRKQKQ
jgi:hypothetical protein